MGWARLDDGFHDHPKLIGLSLEAVGLWTKCLTWAHRHQGGGSLVGHIPDGLPATFAGSRGKRLAAELVEHALWDPESVLGGWTIHDYADYLPASERPTTASEVSRARSEAGRRGAEARWAKASARQADSNLPSSGQSSPMPPTRPDPIGTASPSSHLPERASEQDDDGRSSRRAMLARVGVTDFDRVMSVLLRTTERDLSERQAFQIVMGILEKATDQVKQPQRYVVKSIEQSWAEIQKQVDESVVPV